MTASRTTPYLPLLCLLALGGCSGPEHETMHQHGSHEHEHEHPPRHDGGHDAWIERLDDPGRAAWQRPEEVVAAMALSEGMVVADVGAGTGYFAPHLSRAVGARGKVLALDVDPDLVARMQRRFDEAGLANVEARLVSTSDPGLGAGSVDRALIVDVWHHMEGRVAYAKKLRQALTPTGRLVIVDYPPDAPEGPPPEMRLSAETVISELREAGFDARVVSETLPRQFVVVGEVAVGAGR